MSDFPNLNHEFELSSDEAEKLWHNGVPLPRGAKRKLIEFSRIRLSRNEDGVWVVRLAEALKQADEDVLPETETETDSRIAAGIIKREYTLFHELGGNVISRAVTPINDDEFITTVPWIEDLKPIDRAEFRNKAKPGILAYYEHVAARGGIFLGAGTLILDSHYSRTGNEVFLRDADAYLQEGPSQAMLLKDTI